MRARPSEVSLGGEIGFSALYIMDFSTRYDVNRWLFDSYIKYHLICTEKMLVQHPVVHPITSYEWEYEEYTIKQELQGMISSCFAVKSDLRPW